MIKDLTKKVNDLDLIVAEKDKQIEALEVLLLVSHFFLHAQQLIFLLARY